ncbi:hypothetical protein S7711_10711 [Stachybotrys chartarum IBT 7711]|uniref:Uncharacterized protein n=1 Tax=Stachybotrys chartarum (strain CBS 109288 / IBT 7711) TaxID=1280523 RepID=A0A084AXY3_STACB|nr:hypothetical protein S7711_10711 [Stachybotrys chartarum IBT 7711]
MIVQDDRKVAEPLVRPTRLSCTLDKAAAKRRPGSHGHEWQKLVQSLGRAQREAEQNLKAVLKQWSETMAEESTEREKERRKERESRRQGDEERGKDRENRGDKGRARRERSNTWAYAKTPPRDENWSRDNDKSHRYASRHYEENRSDRYGGWVHDEDINFLYRSSYDDVDKGYRHVHSRDNKDRSYRYGGDSGGSNGRGPRQRTMAEQIVGKFQRVARLAASEQKLTDSREELKLYEVEVKQMETMGAERFYHVKAKELAALINSAIDTHKDNAGSCVTHIADAGEDVANLAVEAFSQGKKTELLKADEELIKTLQTFVSKNQLEDETTEEKDEPAPVEHAGKEDAAKVEAEKGDGAK